MKALTPSRPKGTRPSPLGKGEREVALLEVRDLSVRYGSIEALRGVSLSVMPGEFVAIVGP
ncbi:MAG: ATP-binding cassette domain-containing protein, partial [Thermomicrobiales bacterium]